MTDSNPVRADCERRWPLGVSSATNFRDVGGLRTVSGQQTLWNRLYRGGGHCLDRWDDLLGVGVRVVIDLRMPSETRRMNHALGDMAYYAFPLFRDPHPNWIDPRDQRPAAVAGRYMQMAEGGAAVFQGLVRVLGQLNVPAALVCTAGRDRTGITVGLMLAALGVSDEDIAHDYALSSFAGANHQGSAVAETMMAFLDLIRARHGGADLFLTRSRRDVASLEALKAWLVA